MNTNWFLFNFFRKMKILLSSSMKKNPASAVGKYSNLNRIQEPNYNKASNEAVYLLDVWVYSCIRAIAQAISQIPLSAQTEVDGEWIDDTKGDLYELMTSPNPDDPFSFLLEKVITSLMADGDGYLLFDSGDNELYNLRSKFVKPQTDIAGRLEKYIISDQITTLTQDPAQIIHIRNVNPANEFYGFPASEVVKKTILTKLSMNEYILNYFNNGALAGTTFSTDAPLDDDQRAVIREQFEKLHRGASNAFRMAILDEGVKLDKLSHALKDLVPEQVARMIREEVLAGYNVPHIMVGILDDASYSNADIQKRLFYENNIMPKLAMVENFFNKQLVPQFGDKKRVHFDRSVIQALQENPKEKSERLNQLVNGRNQILTVDEAREELGYEPKGGEFAELNTSVQLADPLTDPDADPTLDPEDDPEATEDEKKYSIKVKRWKAHHSKVLRIEKEFAGIMIKFFGEQENRVLIRLEEISVDGKILSTVLKKDLDRMDSKTLDDDMDVIFNQRRENRLIKKATELKIRRELLTAGQVGIQNILKKDWSPKVSKADQFRVTEPAVREMLKDFMNRMEDINETTYIAIKGLIQTAYDEGLSLDAVAKSIQKEYGFINRVRSKRIAKTEMNGAVNGGNMLGYQQGGANKKEWISAFLPDTRNAHARADSQVVGIDEKFIVGGDELRFPSDPYGSVGNVVNCYCSMIGFEE